MTALTADGHGLWVGGVGYIARVDVNENKISNFARFKAGSVDRLAVGGGYLWAQFDWHLYRIPLGNAE